MLVPYNAKSRSLYQTVSKSVHSVQLKSYCDTIPCNVLLCPLQGWSNFFGTQMCLRGCGLAYHSIGLFVQQVVCKICTVNVLCSLKFQLLCWFWGSRGRGLWKSFRWLTSISYLKSCMTRGLFVKTCSSPDRANFWHCTYALIAN